MLFIEYQQAWLDVAARELHNTNTKSATRELFNNALFKTESTRHFQHWFDLYCKHAFMNCMHDYNDYSQPLILAEDLMKCMCVSVASGYRGVTVKHAIPITSDPPQWHPLHTLGLIILPLRTLGGTCKRGFQLSPCISDVGLHGSSWWAVLQPRIFCLCRIFNACISDR